MFACALCASLQPIQKARGTMSLNVTNSHGSRPRRANEDLLADHSLQWNHQVSQPSMQNKLPEVPLPAGQLSFLARASIHDLPTPTGQMEHESAPLVSTMPASSLHNQTRPQLLQNSTEPRTIHLETRPCPADHSRVHQAPQSRCFCLL